jgi:phospholipase C
VLHDEFDHTSVLKLIEQKWNLPPLTHRDAAAASPLGALDFDAPPAFLTPPELPPAKLGGFNFQARRGGIRRSARRS